MSEANYGLYPRARRTLDMRRALFVIGSLG